MKRYALAYAERGGLRVLPLQPRGKLPLSEHGSHDASTDPGVIARWWDRWPDANVGIATGDGLLVVDLDGAAGSGSWSKLEQEHGLAPSLTARTGSGGQHRFYIVKEQLPNSAGKLGEGIDTRGEGGYIVAPPSVHPSGGHYRWETRSPIADAPAWLVTVLRPPRRREPPRFQPFEALTAYGRAALERLRGDMIDALEGTRNQTLNRIAFTAGRLCAGGQICEADCAQLLRAAESTGLAHREIEATFASGFAAGLAADPIAPPPRRDPITARPPRLSPPRVRA